MTNFGFITEGVTDQIIIEYILNGYFDTNDIIINELQPLRDETDRHRLENYGGWTLVFDYCKSDKFKQAFQYNDYIIIQIDTDVSEEQNYDVSKKDETTGEELEAGELIEKVKDKIKHLIGSEFFDEYRKKIIFAISVHSIECWLLPLYYNDNKRSKMVNCLSTLNRRLATKEGFTIDHRNKKYHYYEKIAKKFRSHRKLIDWCEKNPSFKIFIEELKKIEPLTEYAAQQDTSA